MRPRLRALLLILVLAPAAALGLLGLRSLDAGEEAARREARETAIRVRADLAAGLAREVRGRQLAVEAGTPSELAFRIAPGGAIVEPPTRSFPPRARSFSPGDLVAVRGVLERTDREPRD